MLRLFTDENLEAAIVSGIRLRLPEIDLVTAEEVKLRATPDPDVLRWAADNDRIVLTHDRDTMSDHANKRVEAGQPMPGLFLIRPRTTVRRLIDEIVMIARCSAHEEWRDRVEYVPL